MTQGSEDVRARTLGLVGAYQTLLGQGKLDQWIELWADDGVLEFPFSPVGRKPAYRGKAEILAYMKAAAGKIAIDAMEKVRVFTMQDPELAVAELTIKGRALLTQRPYHQSYVIFFETKNGKLWRYREYWNPLVSIEAFGEGWASEFGTPDDSR